MHVRLTVLGALHVRFVSNLLINADPVKIHQIVERTTIISQSNNANAADFTGLDYGKDAIEYFDRSHLPFDDALTDTKDE